MHLHWMKVRQWKTMDLWNISMWSVNLWRANLWRANVQCLKTPRPATSSLHASEPKPPLLVAAAAAAAVGAAREA
jgi:hypothetical protein